MFYTPSAFPSMLNVSQKVIVSIRKRHLTRVPIRKMLAKWPVDVPFIVLTLRLRRSSVEDGCNGRYSQRQRMPGLFFGLVYLIICGRSLNTVSEYPVMSYGDAS